MKSYIKNIAVLLLLSINLSLAHADDEAITKSLTNFSSSIKIDSINETQIKGLYEVVVGASILYVSEDGKYLLQGHLVDLELKKDLTDLKLADTRKRVLENLGEDKMIVFKAEKSKYTVTIFTDIDCGYCRKLHAEMDKYMAKGITVQYLFFPRAGKGSDSYNKAVSVWCSEDRHAALTSAKKGETLENKTCEHPIDEHMKLGVNFEARGTPMIITQKGNVFPGYVPASELIKVLENE